MAGLMAHRIKIHNDSNDTIALIPFTRFNGEKLHMDFVVGNKLARNIPKKSSVEVKCEDYDLSGKVRGAQINMLFRAGKYPEIVQPIKGEKVFLYTGLRGTGKTEWHLDLDQKNQVTGGPDNAVGQTSSEANTAGLQDAQLQTLLELVRALTQAVATLETTVAALKTSAPEKKGARS